MAAARADQSWARNVALARSSKELVAALAIGLELQPPAEAEKDLATQEKMNQLNTGAGSRHWSLEQATGRTG